MSPLVKQLLEQYEEHDKLIIAFDFDDTISPYHSSDSDYLITGTVNALKEAKKQGHTLVCFTCRDDENEVKHFCQSIGLEYDYFNESPVKIQGGSGKIYYNIFLDDKAGLNESLRDLKVVLSSIKG